MQGFPRLDREDAGGTAASTGPRATSPELRPEDPLRPKETKLEEFLRSSTDGVLAFDRDCRCTLWNSGMERIFGITATEAVGTCVFDVLPVLQDIGEDRRFYEALLGKTAVSRNLPSGRRHEVLESYYFPLPVNTGDIGGAAVIRVVTGTENGESNAQLKALIGALEAEAAERRRREELESRYPEWSPGPGSRCPAGP